MTVLFTRLPALPIFAMISTLGQKLVRQLLNKWTVWTCHKKSWQRINFAGPYGSTIENLAK